MSPGIGEARVARPLRRLLASGLALLLVAGSAWLGAHVGEQRGIAALQVESNHRLELFASAVQGMLKRLEHEPATIQLNHDIQALLREPRRRMNVNAANNYLQRLNAYLGSLSVFVLDDRGVVLATSNTDGKDDSRIGQDLSFRPYFLEALSGRVGRHFAIGINGNRPGYFVSHPIHDGARVVGVAAIKISLDSIDDAWKMLGVPALLADTNQVVILSSQPEWRYTTLSELPLERRVDLQLNRLYSDLRTTRFPLAVELPPGGDRQILDEMLPDTAAAALGAGAGMLILGRPIDGMDWRLLTFSDLRDVHAQALLHGAMSAVAAAFVILAVLYVAQRRRILRQRHTARLLLERVNQQLEKKVDARTRDLTAINERLRNEVAERGQVEQNLRAAQSELVQTAKLAVLGQMATGITHELTQPLGAISTLSGNTIEFLRRGNLDTPVSNLRIIARLADQMGRIIQPLKSFARKSQPTPAHTDIAVAVGNALFLFDLRLRKESVAVRNHCTPGTATAWCDPNRLEQVLINLIGNAIDAMAAAPLKVLTIEAAPCELARGPHDAAPCPRVHGVSIDVLDTGSGFADQARTQVFEPFFTTKPSGAGLGLGLTISRDIVREFGGDIEAAARPEGGARFTVRLLTGPHAPATNLSPDEQP